MHFQSHQQKIAERGHAFNWFHLATFGSVTEFNNDAVNYHLAECLSIGFWDVGSFRVFQIIGLSVIKGL